jgi:hypothetical protein
MVQSAIKIFFHLDAKKTKRKENAGKTRLAKVKLVQLINSLTSVTHRDEQHELLYSMVEPLFIQNYNSLREGYVINNLIDK